MGGHGWVLDRDAIRVGLSLGAMRHRSLTLSLGLMVGTICAGLAVRFVPLGLPRLVVKYGGSMLWALMIYWVVSTLWSRRGLIWAVGVSGVVATGVEFFKLYHSPGMDAFRLTLPGWCCWGECSRGGTSRLTGWRSGLGRG